jgi:hypothetical protein
VDGCEEQWAESEDEGDAHGVNTEVMWQASRIACTVSCLKCT